MITTKITIKPHLAEYIKSKFGGETDGCIRFSERLDIYHTIWDLTERRPVQCPPDSGNLEIVLPDRREGKSPETYNYLGKKAQKIIERRIENIFIAELHDYVIEEKNRYGTSYIEAIFLFSRKYAIESISEDGLKKNCYRWIRTLRIRKKRSYERKKNLPTE
jgi:hypothetical protein